MLINSEIKATMTEFTIDFDESCDMEKSFITLVEFLSLRVNIEHSDKSTGMNSTETRTETLTISVNDALTGHSR